MSALELVASNPFTAVVLAALVVCVIVGVVDRLMEPARLRAQARGDEARARLLHESRESGVEPPGTDDRYRRPGRWGKGS